MSNFKEIPELQIGSITEVSGSSIRVELNSDISELKRTFKGRVYPIGQFASVVKIHYGRRILVAYVRLLRMRSDLMIEEGQRIPSNFEDSRLIEADLFGEGIWDSTENHFEFTRGVSDYPVPGQSVYLTTQEELSEIYRGGEKEVYNNFSTSIDIGTYVGSGGTPCHANYDKLMGLHSAILGSTGSGKSGTVAALIHSILEHKTIDNGDQKLRPRIVIIDPHGEYAKAFKDKSIVYKAYDELIDEEQEHVKQLKLPYWTLSGEEFRELIVGKTEYEATSENNIVYKALEHARLVQRGYIEPSREWIGEKVEDGFSPDAPRAIQEKFEPLIAAYNRDTPDPFSLKEIENHILLEQGIRIKKGKWDPLPPSKLDSYESVLDKISVLRSDPRLKFMMEEFNDGDPDLAEILNQFIGEVDINDGNKANLKIIDISGLPNEIAGPLTASISRLLFQYKVWQKREEREEDPILLVCEEAHRYVPDTGLAEYKSAQNAVRRLAKEGRKYGIGLMLVSQRPSDVESTVLSQCNSWIVLRLTNSSDQQHVNKFLPDSLAGLSRLLPSLGRQEAIFVGEASAIPARIKIKDLEEDQLPRSDDISFIKGWSQLPIKLDQIEKVVARWRKEQEDE